MRKNLYTIALADITAAFIRCSLVGMLAYHDLRQRYQRSTLGPFWITISMGVMIGIIGTIFGRIFKSSNNEFLPFLAAGMIFWNFFSSVISEGCTCFMVAEGIIKQLPIPLFVHLLRVVWRNILIMAHNILIFPIVIIIVDKPLTLKVFVSIPGLLLVIVNLSWMALILGILCTRYRDLPQIVGAIMQVIFYLTPVMWMPSLLPQRAEVYLLDVNPVYHLIEIIRSPLLGQLPSANNWIVCFALAFGGWLFALAMYGRYKRRIPYWL
ncbi:MAG: ABC transporter permease [Deltaproteobacteria bacterium]|nr:ABC transporter permease [Deltaproteobacteria bacterium]